MSRPVVVLKFGGAALADPAEVIAQIRREAAQSRVVVVVSARDGITELLRRVLRRPRARRRHAAILERIARAHPGLGPSGRHALARTRAVVRSVERAGSADPRRADRLLAEGERLAVHWLARQMQAAGLAASPLEADRIGLVTDGAYGAAIIQLPESTAPVRRALSREFGRRRIPVVTGFLGRSAEGRVTTLGPGGSDYTATALGAIVRASRVELVKRRMTVRSADPALVPRARPLDRLSYGDAEELAQFGARILHPLSIGPARRAGIPLAVRALEGVGPTTVIGASPSLPGTRATVLLEGRSLLRLRFPGGRGRLGVAAAVTGALALAGINVDSVFSSSAALTVAVGQATVPRALRALAPLLRGGVGELDPPVAVGLVTAIGDGVLRDTRRLPPRVLRRTLGLAGTARSTVLAVPAAEARRALRATHRALVESPGGLPRREGMRAGGAVGSGPPPQPS